MNRNTLQLFIVIALPLLLVVSCGTSDSTPVEENGTIENGKAAGQWQTLNVDEFSARLHDEGAVLVDVRTDAEIEHGKIAGAIQIEFNSANMEAQFAEMDKNKPVLIYCASGRRSNKTMKILKGMGFQIVYELDGGIGAWQNAGKPLVRP